MLRLPRYAGSGLILAAVVCTVGLFLPPDPERLGPQGLEPLSAERDPAPIGAGSPGPRFLRAADPPRAAAARAASPEEGSTSTAAREALAWDRVRMHRARHDAQRAVKREERARRALEAAERRARRRATGS